MAHEKDSHDTKEDGSDGSDRESHPESERPVHGTAAVAHAGGAHAAAHEEHGLGHVTPIQLLVGVLVLLLFLTVVTVYTAGIDLGHQWNLVVALVIATVKASLVVTYFMHIRWDHKLHLVVFMSSVLFLILFLSMSLADRKEYQHTIDLVDHSQQPTPADFK